MPAAGDKAHWLGGGEAKGVRAVTAHGRARLDLAVHSGVQRDRLG